MVGNANGKKYTMIVFEEDERYGSNGIQLGFYSDNPWEGNLSDIVEGDNIEELWKSSDGHSNEGLFYMLYENETGKRVGYGIVDYGAIRDEIAECEKESETRKFKANTSILCSDLLNNVTQRPENRWPILNCLDGVQREPALSKITESENENKFQERSRTVKTICYGEEREWDSREEAMNFFLEGMCFSEGSEFERYAKIYIELTLGLEVCSDEIEY